MISHLPANTRARIDDIRATHRATTRTRWQRLLRKPASCVMCGVPIGWCQQLKWVDRVTTGKCAPAGWIPQQRRAEDPVRDATWWGD